MKPLPSSGTYAGWLAIVRILTGVAWLSHAIPKFTDPDKFMPPNGFMAQYVTQGLQNTSGFYHSFLVNTVQPNLQIFAELDRLGELLVGVALVLGLFSRFAGLVGIFLPLNYLAARGDLLSSGVFATGDVAIALLSAISLFLPTGSRLGIDALIGRRKSTVPTVRAEFVPEPPMAPPPPAPEPTTTQAGPTT